MSWRRYASEERILGQAAPGVALQGEAPLVAHGRQGLEEGEVVLAVPGLGHQAAVLGAGDVAVAQASPVALQGGEGFTFQIKVVQVHQQLEVGMVYRLHQPEALPAGGEDVGLLLVQGLHAAGDAVGRRRRGDVLPAQFHQLGKGLLLGEALGHMAGAAAAKDHHLHAQRLGLGQVLLQVAVHGGEVRLGACQPDVPGKEHVHALQGHPGLFQLGRPGPHLVQALAHQRGKARFGVIRPSGGQLEDPILPQGGAAAKFHTEPTFLKKVFNRCNARRGKRV